MIKSDRIVSMKGAKDKMKRKINKSAISLITLVITIIIMIILAGAIVVTLSNSGIFTKANDAVDAYDIKQAQTLADTIWAEAYLNPNITTPVIAGEDNELPHISALQFVLFVFLL